MHVGFKDVKVFRQWYEAIKRLVEYIYWEKVRDMIFAPEVVEMLETKANDEETRYDKNV